MRKTSEIIPAAHAVPVIAGQPSAALVAELKAIGERVTTRHLTDAILHLEAARVGFVVEAIATGILLRAKREHLPHGGWQRFCAELWAEVKGNGQRVSLSGDDLPSALHNFTRSLRGYCFLAQHFLADLEQGHFQPEHPDEAVALPEVKTSDVLALDTLPQEQRIAVYNAIERFVAGRSLRRMLSDFRRAENAAEVEEAEEAAEAAKRKARKSASGGGAGQLDFYEDMMRPVGEIDALFEDKTFVARTNKEFWLGLEKKLRAQAARAAQIAKEIR